MSRALTIDTGVHVVNVADDIESVPMRCKLSKGFREGGLTCNFKVIMPFANPMATCLLSRFGTIFAPPCPGHAQPARPECNTAQSCLAWSACIDALFVG